MANSSKDNAVRPLELEAHAVRSTNSGDTLGFFTRVLVNDEKFGVLTPDKYRILTNRNRSCVQLAQWALSQLSMLPARFRTRLDGGFISAYVPFRMFANSVLEKALDGIALAGSLPTEQLVIELSSDVLYENTEELSTYMSVLRQKYGVKFLLSDYGTQYCPALRLGSFSFDYVLSDSSICNEKTLCASYVKDAVRIARENGAQAIFGFVASRLTEAAKESGFELYLSTRTLVPDGRCENA